MATHSSILAWEILWREEPGGLQSMRSQESDRTEHTARELEEHYPTETQAYNSKFSITATTLTKTKNDLMKLILT